MIKGEQAHQNRQSHQSGCSVNISACCNKLLSNSSPLEMFLTKSTIMNLNSPVVKCTKVLLVPLWCSKCKNLFCSNEALENHLLTEHIDTNNGRSDEKPVECTICGKQLKNKFCLYGHMKSVHDDQQVKCKVCSKQVKNKHGSFFDVRE